MYIFVDENTIVPYDGEVLKRYVGKRLIKTISNPTNAQLKEFGYMELIEGNIPEYNKLTQYLLYEYYTEGGNIYRRYTVNEISKEVN